MLRNPLFQGSPIKAGVIGEPAFLEDSRAHMVCRLAGYARAAMRKYDPIYRRNVISRDNTRLFDTTSIFETNREAQQWWSVTELPDSYRISFEVPTNLKSTIQPRFTQIRRAHSCAKMAACMDYEVNNMREERLTQLNPAHPFVRQCMSWGTRSDEPYAYSEITCETNPASPWQPSMARRMAEFHNTTNNQYRVTQGSLVEAGFGIQEIELCRGNAGYSSSNLYRPAIGSCDYVPEYNQENWMLNLLGGDTLEMYLTLSDRLRVGPRVGPRCAQDILANYTHAVIPDEYGLSSGLLARMKQPFCVEAISPITINSADGTCSFEVQTKDFLQRSSSITVSFGADNGELPSAQCESQARCFAESTLSCEHANFCPAPGLIQRRDH